MAAPNIVAVTAIYGKSTYYTPNVGTAVVLLANPSGSGKVLRINQIVCSNISAANAAASVSIYTNGAVAQGSAPAGGTAYAIISAVTVPINASLIALDKTTSLYLEEDKSITITSGTSGAITYTISYEEIS